MWLSAFVALTSFGQTSLNGTNGVLDTLTNSNGPKYLTSNLIPGTTGKYAVQISTTNISGTSTITAVLQGSLDGVLWDNIYHTAGTTGVACDTLSISGNTVHTFWVAPNFTSNAGRRMYVRVKFVSGATQSTQIKGKYITSN